MKSDSQSMTATHESVPGSWVLARVDIAFDWSSSIGSPQIRSTFPGMDALLTQYMGPSSAYAAVLHSIDQDVRKLLKSNGDIFTFSTQKQGTVDIRDFQTTGVVAFARGCPFYELKSGRLDVMGQRIQVNEEYRQNCIEAMRGLVNLL